MLDIKCITLNNIEYYVLDEIILDEKKYLLLSRVDNEQSVLIKKLVTHNNEKYCCSVNDKEEFNKVALEFNKKINS